MICGPEPCPVSRAAGGGTPEQQVAELLLGGHDQSHLRDRDLEDRAGFPDDRRDVDATAGEQVQLPEELALGAHGELPLVRLAVPVDDRHGAREDREEVIRVVALAEEHLADLRGPHPPTGAQDVELLVGQLREGGLLLVGRRDAVRGHRLIMSARVAWRVAPDAVEHALVVICRRAMHG
jgi:hypothetical protein